MVFAGNELPNKDESLPYVPLDKHVDYYSRTKSIAEQVLFVSQGNIVYGAYHLYNIQAILAANGSPIKNGKNGKDNLLTCALRPAGIYGEVLLLKEICL